MKKGFYYMKTRNSIRCYYLTGEKSGNKWIDIAGVDGNELVYLHDPQWMALNWMCLPQEVELKKWSDYSEENPTKYILN